MKTDINGLFTAENSGVELVSAVHGVLDRDVRFSRGSNWYKIVL